LSKAAARKKAIDKRVRLQAIKDLRRIVLKQDMPAELIFLSEYRQKSRVVLQKDRGLGR